MNRISEWLQEAQIQGVLWNADTPDRHVARVLEVAKLHWIKALPFGAETYDVSTARSRRLGLIHSGRHLRPR